MINIQSVASKVQGILRDEIGEQFSAEKIYSYLYEAELKICELKQDALTVDVEYSCTAGLIQDISPLTPRPIRLLSVIKNSQDTYVHRLSRERLERFSSSQEAAGVIMGYVIDPREKTKFDVYPPALDGATITVRYIPYPSEYGTVDESTTSSVGAEYEPAIVNYTLMRCLLEDEEASPNIGKAQIFINEFNNQLGLSTQDSIRISPQNPATEN